MKNDSIDDCLRTAQDLNRAVIKLTTYLRFGNVRNIKDDLDSVTKHYVQLGKELDNIRSEYKVQ